MINYMNMITFKKVSNPFELEEVYKLRYKVYCEEWGFERIEDHPGEREADEFDEYSVHFIAQVGSQIIGTLRLILHSEKGFPAKKHCIIEKDLTFQDDGIAGEISRLAISKEYRKRAEDRALYDGIIPVVSEVPQAGQERRGRQDIVCGLYKELYLESKRRGLVCWYAVMAKGLYILLYRLGMVFRPIGPEVEYHGKRRPYMANIEEIEKEVARKRPEIFKNFTNGFLQ